MDKVVPLLFFIRSSSYPGYCIEELPKYLNKEPTIELHLTHAYLIIIMSCSQYPVTGQLQVVSLDFGWLVYLSLKIIIC